MHAPRRFTPFLYLAVFVTVAAWGMLRPAMHAMPHATASGASARAPIVEVAAIGPGEMRRVAQRMMAH